MNQLYQLFRQCSSVCTDTRKIDHDCIFFALKGDHFNGNLFAETAIKLGAKYAVVDEEIGFDSSSIIKVDNVLQSLQDLANYHRKILNTPIIALTGSNGKTTTKELINAVLATKFKTIATKGNLNNHIGVPLTLLSITVDTEIAIVEMGANHQKEIEFLCSIAEPDYGLITNYGKAHLEGFGGFEGVIKGKTEMYIHLKDREKTIFFNAEDQVQKDNIGAYQNKYSFSVDKPGDLIIKLNHIEPAISVIFDNTEINTNLTGAYNINNIAYAVLIGNNFQIPTIKIKEGLESYIPKNNRSQILLTNFNKLILDAYNANPSSMFAAIQSFQEIKHSNKIAILGDMFELGEAASHEHQNIINELESTNFNQILLIGSLFNACQIKASHFIKLKSFEEASNYLDEVKIKDALILIKASRGMALERLVPLL